MVEAEQLVAGCIHGQVLAGAEDEVGASVELGCELPFQVDVARDPIHGRQSVAVGVVAVAGLRAGAVKADQAVATVVVRREGQRRGVGCDRSCTRTSGCARSPQVLRDAHDPAGRVIAVAGNLALRHAAIAVKASGCRVAIAPAPCSWLVQCRPRQLAHESVDRLVVAAGLRGDAGDLAACVAVIDDLQAARIGDAGQLSCRVAVAGCEFAGAFGVVVDVLDFFGDAAQLVAAVGRRARFVFDAAQVPGLGRGVPAVVDLVACCVVHAARAAQSVSRPGRDVALGIRLLDHPAHRIVLGIHSADVRAGLAGRVAKGVGGVAGLHALGVSDGCELIKLAPGLTCCIAVGKGGNCGAAQAVQRLARGLRQRVGLAHGLAVGVVAQLRGLAHRALHVRDLVEDVDDARRHLGDRIGSVPHFLTGAVAGSVQRVGDFVAPVVTGTGQALGVVVAIVHDVPAGQLGAGKLAGCVVAVDRGLTACGLLEQAPARVPGPGGDEAIGVGLALGAPRRVIGIHSVLAQRVLDACTVSHCVIAVLP